MIADSGFVCYGMSVSAKPGAWRAAADVSGSALPKSYIVADYRL
jgi:hypothetical protein